MPTMLPPDLEQFLQVEVASGKYSSPDEALVAGVLVFRWKGMTNGKWKRVWEVTTEVLP